MDLEDNPNFIFEVLKIAVPSVLVIVGWGIVYFLQHRMAHKLQTRKDIRDNIGFLKLLIKEFKEHCVSYHTETINQILDSTITSEFNQITQDLLRLMNTLPIQSDEVMGILVEVSKDATGGDFGTKGKKKKELNDAKLIRLMEHLNLLILKVEEAYWKKFSN